jgi:hydrogenase expression/formation protein HypC
MCLAVPGKIISISGDEQITKIAKVDFAGIRKDISVAFVPEANVGDYVIVHVGFALSVINEKEAQEVFEYLKEFDELDELERQKDDPE